MGGDLSGQPLDLAGKAARTHDHQLSLLFGHVAHDRSLDAEAKCNSGRVFSARCRPAGIRGSGATCLRPTSVVCLDGDRERLERILAVFDVDMTTIFSIHVDPG